MDWNIDVIREELFIFCDVIIIPQFCRRMSFLLKKHAEIFRLAGE